MTGAAHGYPGATTGTAGEAPHGPDRAPGAERARLLHHQCVVPPEDGAGGVRDARGAVRGSGVWRGGDPRARPGKKAAAVLTSRAAPEVVAAAHNGASEDGSAPDPVTGCS